MRICNDCIRDKDAIKFIGNEETGKCNFCNDFKITHEINRQSIQYLSIYIMKNYCYLDYAINASSLFPGVISSISFETILSRIFNLNLNNEIIVNYFANETGFNKCSLPECMTDMHLFFPIDHKNVAHSDWLKIENDLKANNYYNVFPACNHFDKLYILKKEIEPDNIFFRARIGYNTEKVYCDDIWEEELNFPYVQDEMLAPPPILCTPGRLNRNGISHLYIADTLDTAIAEVKPSPSNVCSIAKIRIKNKLKMIDLRKCTIDTNFLSLDYNSYYFYYTVSKRLSEPLESKEQNRYLITQYLADIIRSMNFDGIIYDSAMTFGVNYLIFDNRNATVIKNSEYMVKINKIKFLYKNCDDERKTFNTFLNFNDEEKNNKYALD